MTTEHYHLIPEDAIEEFVEDFKRGNPKRLERYHQRRRKPHTFFEPGVDSNTEAQAADTFNHLMNANMRIRWALRILEVSVGGPHPQVRKHLNRAVRQLLHELPWMLCPRCDGGAGASRTGCSTCSRRGYLTYGELHLTSTVESVDAASGLEE